MKSGKETLRRCVCVTTAETEEPATRNLAMEAREEVDSLPFLSSTLQLSSHKETVIEMMMSNSSKL
jgi:hypothetical protein